MDSLLTRRIAERGTLIGCAIDSANPAWAEMAARLGYDIIWGDLEHCNINPRDADNLCRAANGAGAFSLLRINGWARTQILAASECGADIIVIPMVESRETSLEIVQHGKFRPVGNRGLHGATRGLQYGIGDRLDNMARLNRETHLFVQIETAEAARRCEEIVNVDGLTGGLVGPADLSITMGKPLAFDDAEVRRVFRDAIRAIHGVGKIAATAVGHPGLVEIALEEKNEILVCAVESDGLRGYFQNTLERVRGLVAR